MCSISSPVSGMGLKTLMVSQKSIQAFSFPLPVQFSLPIPSKCRMKVDVVVKEQVWNNFFLILNPAIEQLNCLRQRDSEYYLAPLLVQCLLVVVQLGAKGTVEQILFQPV